MLFSAACSGEKQADQVAQPSPSTASSPAPAPVTVAVTAPAADATGVAASAEIAYKSDDPAGTTVEVKDAAGKTVAGTQDKDAKVFRPAKALSWGKKYTVTVASTAGAGGSTASSFTVMKKPGKLVSAQSNLSEGQTVGVGMPLMIIFDRDVPKKQRAAVERRMQVTATPAQEGSWSWTRSNEVHYRPKVYWQAKTKLSYRLHLAGVPMGDGYYGGSELTGTAKIGRSLVMTVDNKTKIMTVERDGKVAKKIPVSMGKSGFPTVSGTMLVMSKERRTVFNTIGRFTGEDAYNKEIEYAQRLTWGGQYIHAAPWSNWAQGNSNVSHGCLNVSQGLGAWLFENTTLGDPVVIRGTGAPLENGDGWTDWNVSWAKWRKGSAL
ncbi:Ig-like domain-containing protein [Actinoplanes sp. NPDC051859]|uniref:L,D-transpeptidase n=1 Tax=Actinoplanes sp. NPDC051859 TaxID=3363909 RepID=UPI00378A6546